MIESTTPKKNADKKVPTVNPGTTCPATQIRNALITNVKRPSVSILIGSVNIISTGLMKALRIPNTNATMSAEINPLTLTPGSRYAVARIATVLTNQFIIICIFFVSYLFKAYA